MGASASNLVLRQVLTTSPKKALLLAMCGGLLLWAWGWIFLLKLKRVEEVS